MFLEKLKNDVEVCESFNKTLVSEHNCDLLFFIRRIILLLGHSVLN